MKGILYKIDLIRRLATKVDLDSSNATNQAR